MTILIIAIGFTAGAVVASYVVLRRKLESINQLLASILVRIVRDEQAAEKIRDIKYQVSEQGAALRGALEKAKDV